MMEIEVHPEVIGLKAGLKQMWLRMHRAEVEAYYHEHGPDATRQRFNMTENTLKAFWDRRGKDIRMTKWSQSDKEVYQVLMEGQREIKRRVSRLEEWQAEIEPVIQVGRGLVATLGQLQAQSQISGENQAVARLDNIGKKSGK